MRCCAFAGRAGPIRARRIRISCWARCCGSSVGHPKRWQRGERPRALTPRFWRHGRRLPRRCSQRGTPRARSTRPRMCWHLRTGNARAELIVAIARMMLVAAAEGARRAAVERVLEREPGLIGVATLSGPLALALDRVPPSPERSACSTALRAQRTHWQPRRCCSRRWRWSMRRTSRARACGDARLWWLRFVPVPWRRPNSMRCAGSPVAAARFDHGAARELSARLAGCARRR